MLEQEALNLSSRKNLSRNKTLISVDGYFLKNLVKSLVRNIQFDYMYRIQK